MNATLQTRMQEAGAVDVEVRSQVLGILATFRTTDVVMERRHNERHAFPRLVRLTPVGPDGLSPEGETVVVVGKNLSEEGLGFFHRETLPHRRYCFFHFIKTRCR